MFKKHERLCGVARLFLRNAKKVTCRQIFGMRCYTGCIEE